MTKFCVLAAILSAIVINSQAQPGPPELDKQQLEIYVRYAEGFTKGVKITLDDPTPSAIKDYYRVVAHLIMGAQKADRVYYVTRDGQHLIAGNLWELSKNPFADTLEHLPSNGPSFGPGNAKVTITVFSDFECPYCREFAKTVRDNLRKKYPADVRVVFEDFPLDAIHKWARAAAEAAHCIANQNPESFWLFHDWLFEHQQEVNQGNVREKTLDFAKGQNLDPAKVGTCIDTHATAQVVEENLAAGRMLQIQQTPTVFVNGRTIPGAVPWSTLDTVIQMELNRPKEIPGPSTEKCCEVTIPTVVKK
ncbi:MAG TPA: DsbA family protein [Bryobacteraceae bacterium]|nr:DsbA family protein [Bryobacteraceae bacterium]